MPRPLYIEIQIAAPFEVLWEHTQNPSLHERWDLRFSRIEYLPRSSDDAPQEFLYETRIGFGLRIRGRGESVGTHETEDESTSALKFGSDDPKSLIRTGSGYWKYIRRNGSIQFLTLYDYDVRFGAVGRVIDALIFRPLLGWATAWSFDRLRLWLDCGIDPALSAFRALINACSRLTLAIIFLYHGLIPKLLFMHPDERVPLEAVGFSAEASDCLVILVGWCEIVYAGLLLLLPFRAIYLITIGLLSFLAIGALGSVPRFFIMPFNPVTLTIAMVSIAAIGYFVSRNLPSARRCIRKQPRRESR